MTLSVESTAIKLRAAYQIGLQHRKNGQTITLREDYIKQRLVTDTEAEVSLIEDMYTAYAKGYRSFIPTPREVTVNNGW